MYQAKSSNVAIVIDTNSGRTWGHGDPEKVGKTFELLLTVQDFPEKKSLACIVGNFTAQEVKKIKSCTNYALAYCKKFSNLGQTSKN